MTSALRLALGPLLSALLFASPAAGGRHSRAVAGRHSPAVAPQRPDDPAECLRLASLDEAFAGALQAGALAAESAGFSSVRLSGSASFPEEALWDLTGGPAPSSLSRDDAIALAARLVQTGLFSAVEPRVRGDALEIALTENPIVGFVQVRGLSEFRTEDVLDWLLEAPTGRELDRRRQEVREARRGECPAPLPPRVWLARIDGGEVRGGVLWRGLRPALGRVMRMLRSRGYPLARLKGELTAAGELLIDVDEGRAGGVEVRGVDAHLSREVELELGVRRGDVVSIGELYNALDRVERRWPFLRPDRRDRRTPPAAVLRIRQRLEGGVEFGFELPEPPAVRSIRPRPGSRPPPPRDEEEVDDDDSDEPRARPDRDEPRARPDRDDPRARPDRDDFFGDLGLETHSRKHASRNAWYGFEGDTLVVNLRAERSRGSLQPVELLRHTPVTGFAPGLAGTLTIYDPGDRVHLLLDGAVNINTRRPGRDATGGTFLERLNAQERVDWLLGPRLRIPGLNLAELGGQLYTLTDTADRWRIARIDSYLYSAILNRADREYYRRSGVAAFITAHLFESLTLGAEYRRDRYALLAAPPRVWSLFNRTDPRYGSAPVDEGEMGSAVFRLEYRSEKEPLHAVGSMWRNPETSLIEAEPLSVGLRTLNTVEVADRSLGGTFAFTRIVSDTSLALQTGRHDTLTLRLRGAGGHDLPRQKAEGLGGWTALRGYDFKEFRGDASLLGTVQLEGRYFGAFLDVGSVHQGGTGWLDPKPSAGALFNFASGSTHLEAAWRLDGQARLVPDVRVLFAVPL